MGASSSGGCRRSAEGCGEPRKSLAPLPAIRDHCPYRVSRKGLPHVEGALTVQVKRGRVPGRNLFLFFLLPVLPDCYAATAGLVVGLLSLTSGGGNGSNLTAGV